MRSDISGDVLDCSQNKSTDLAPHSRAGGQAMWQTGVFDSHKLLLAVTRSRGQGHVPRATAEALVHLAQRQLSSSRLQHQLGR